MSFHADNKDGKHYWLTPPDLMKSLNEEFEFDFDACPYPKPDEFDGLICDWGKSTWVNPPFGSIIQDGEKKGPTAWARKAITEHHKGNRSVLVYPTDKWIHYLMREGAQMRSLGDIHWHAIEDGSRGPGIGRYLMAFILPGKNP